MKNLLIEILETLNYPVKQLGSIEENESYPDSFFTFWENTSYDGSHYDNDCINCIWAYNIRFYSVDPTLVNTILIEVKKKLRKNGFIVSGRGYDVPSDEITHIGKAIDAVIIEGV